MGAFGAGGAALHGSPAGIGAGRVRTDGPHGSSAHHEGSDSCSYGEAASSLFESSALVVVTDTRSRLDALALGVGDVKNAGVVTDLQVVTGDEFAVLVTLAAPEL